MIVSTPTRKPLAGIMLAVYQARMDMSIINLLRITRLFADSEGSASSLWISIPYSKTLMDDRL